MLAKVLLLIFVLSHFSCGLFYILILDKREPLRQLPPAVHYLPRNTVKNKTKQVTGKHRNKDTVEVFVSRGRAL